METLIKRGIIVTATETYWSDILSKDEKIAAIGVGLKRGQNTPRHAKTALYIKRNNLLKNKGK